MLRRLARLVLLAGALLICAAPALAHPHVWVTMHSDLIYGPDGSITGIRHHWAFDDMYSAFALQGLESKEKGKYTREELQPLAKVNVESLKEFDYFTFATVDGQKVPLGEPLSDYSLDYADSVLTLNFTLPFKMPLKAKSLTIDIYDPTIFVDFAFDKEHPVKWENPPKGCKLQIALPREMTYAEGKALSDIPADQPNLTMKWGAQFANKILVNCQ
jgi:ABC-type uncharacterized transport system substrate-binding protein